MAHRVRTDRRLEGATTHVIFTARPAPRVRRQLRIAGATVIAAALLVGVGLPLITESSVSVTTVVWVPALLPVWIAILGDADGREVAVTDAGLRVQRALHEWEAFSAYERTADELAVYRTAWYRSTFAFDVEDIDDTEAVLEALARYLPARQ